ncbi:hypothetical protein [Mycobacterium leprae]|uniref:hypothetical protein n=1 Tax=Mycobacterium leprae TaxID=1769 RepID=UPI00195517F6|nr:hypothetical protein [Mycobacterium leprae]
MVIVLTFDFVEGVSAVWVQVNGVVVNYPGWQKIKTNPTPGRRHLFSHQGGRPNGQLEAELK